MGKVEEEQHLPISVIGEAQRADQNAGNDNGRGCCIFKKFVSFRCVFALLFGVAVLLSAIFWLPIFHYGDQKDLDLDSEYAGTKLIYFSLLLDILFLVFEAVFSALFDAGRSLCVFCGLCVFGIWVLIVF